MAQAAMPASPFISTALYIEWQKDISFHWNKQIDKKYQRNNNTRRSQK